MKYALLALPLITFQATAQMMCAPAKQYAEQLEKQYGETLAVSGLSDREYLVQFYMNDITGTFTVVLLRSDGLACPVDQGGSAVHLSRKLKEGPVL